MRRRSLELFAGWIDTDLMGHPSGNRIRRPLFALLATGLLVGTAAFAPLTPAVASTHHAKVVVATGDVSCGEVSGSVTYHPPEHHVGTVSEKIKFVFRASHCTTRGSDVKHVLAGSLSETVARPSNACASGIFSHPVTATGSWKAKNLTLHDTTGTFSGWSFVFAANGDVGFEIPNKGGSARITGSFAGSNHGATSSIVSYINLSAKQVRAACLSAHGLASVRITRGRATFS